MVTNKKINLEELIHLPEADNNVYMEGSNILIEKHMHLNETEASILKKWRINDFEMRSHIETSVEGFSILYQYDKENFTRLYAAIQREIQDYYENIEKDYKVPFPNFDQSFQQLLNMSTVKSLSFVFHMHLYPCNSLIKCSTRTAVYSVLIAKRLNLTNEQIKKVFYGSIVSEIGFLKRSENYLINNLSNKDEITPLHFDYLKQHVSLGMEIYKKLLNYPKEYALMLLLHHDYNDKSGYNKVGSEKLVIESQIITVCQEFAYATSNFLEDAIEPLNYTNAIITMLKNEKKYNSQVLNAFVSLFTFYPPGMFLLLSDGTIAISVVSRTHQPNLPTIEKVADEKGNILPEAETLITERSHLKILANLSNKKIIRKIIRAVYA